MGTRIIASNKLTMPMNGRAVVQRQDLMPRLEDSTWRVSAVCAPAGFGKTTLLANWASEHAESTSWLSCDTADREPIRFWTGLIASLSSRWPGLGDDALALFEQSGGLDRDGAISLANDLADVGDPVAIVIDDLHLAKPAPAVLSAFVAALPAAARVVFGSRLTTPFPLARLRLAGQLLEIQSDDLRFSLEETAALIEGQGIELDGDELERLHTSTEGWPAAVQLSAMSLRRHPDRRRFLHELAVTDQAIGDFLVNEVLADLPEDWQEFLAATSILDEFDTDLCVRMTGRDDAGALLQEFLKADLFVVPLDDRGTWYRYHHLFGAFLRARVRASRAERFAQLKDRASEALEDRGLVVAAMRHAFANDDPERAAELVRRSFGRVMHPVDVELSGAAARLWLHEHGERLARTDPIVVLEMVVTVQLTSGTDEVARWLTYVERVTPDPSPIVKAYLHGIWGEHFLLQGRPEEALHHSERAMAVYGGDPPNEGLLPLLYPQVVRAHVDSGDIDAARTVCDRARGRSMGNAVLDLVRLPAMRAWIAWLDGDLQKAERLARGAERHAEEIGAGDHEPGIVFSALTLACLDAERLRDDEARDAFERARRAADAVGRPSLQSAVAFERAVFARSVGDAESAAAELQIARKLLAAPSATVIARFDREEWLQTMRFEPRVDVPPAEVVGHRDELGALVRCLVERDERATAAALAERLPQPRTTRELLEAALLAALVAPGVDEALGDLHTALEIGAREGYFRSILGAGSAIPTLLAAVPTQAHDGFVTALLEAAVAIVASSTSGADALVLVDPLSPSEVTVLRYLSSRLSNHEIAAALYISINTLKTHVKTVYRKLGVSSRADAVAAGRRIRII